MRLARTAHFQHLRTVHNLGLDGPRLDGHRSSGITSATKLKAFSDSKPRTGC
jgi:hypothetical protein